MTGAVVEHRRPSAMWWFGAALAFAGTAALIINRGLSFNVFNDGSSIFGDLIILGGGAVCALGYVAGGKLSPKIGTVATTFWGLAVALVLLIPVFTVIIGRTVWVAVPGAGWLSILWMSLLSSLAGYVLWFYALGRGGIGRIGSLQMAQPVVTLVAAAVILSETLTIPLLATGAMIITGTFTAQCHVR